MVFSSTLARKNSSSVDCSGPNDSGSREPKHITPSGEPDSCLVLPSTFGMGFMTHGTMTPYLGPGSYGHPGAGGSVAFASPEAEIGFGYVMNRMDNNLADDPRTTVLTAAITQVLGR